MNLRINNNCIIFLRTMKRLQVRTERLKNAPFSNADYAHLQNLQVKLHERGGHNANCIVQITDPVLSKQKRLQSYVLCISLDIIVLQHSWIWIFIYKMLCFFPIKLSSPQCWSVSTVKTLLLPASSEAPKGSAPCHVPRGIFNMHETLRMQQKPCWTNHTTIYTGLQPHLCHIM